MQKEYYLEIGNKFYLAEKICDEKRGENTPDKAWYRIRIDGKDRVVLFKMGTTIGEVITYKIAKKLGFSCCRAENANLINTEKHKIIQGCISFNELLENEELSEAIVIAEKYFSNSDEFKQYEMTGVISFDFAIKILEMKVEEAIREKYSSTQISLAELSEIISKEKKANVKKFIEVVVGLDIPLLNSDENLENWGFACGGKDIIRIYQSFDNASVLALDWEDEIMVDTR